MCKKILANLFFLFFTSPILSPAIYSNDVAAGNVNAGSSFYLFWAVMLVDVYFINYILVKIKNNATFKQMAGVLLFFGWSFSLLEFSMIARMVAIFASLGYLYYAYQNRLFYLFRWMNFNILIALVQYICALYFPAMYEHVTPSSIAVLIWGGYARPTFDNLEGAFEDAAFETALGLSPIRVAGLSSEGGFFASLICMSLIISWRFFHERKQCAFLLVGLLLSLSKVTLLLIPLILILTVKKYLNLIPFFLGMFLLCAALGFLGEWTCQNLYLSETFMHRFAGYYAVDYMDVDNLLMGIKKGVVMNPQMYHDAINMEFFPYRFNTFSGYPDMINHIGYIGFLLFLLMLNLMDVQFGQAAFLILGTITVTLTTVTSFSILCYFIIFFDRSKYFRMGG